MAGALTTLALACAPKPADTAADEAAIHALVQAFNDHLKAQNDSAIGAMYVADAVLMPPNLPRVSGADSIRQFWAQIWPLKATLEITPTSVRASGDLAVEEGNWTWSMPTPAGDQKDNGKYLVSWRKVDGQWRIAQDMWSSDNPPPPPPPSSPPAR
jgi:uncharacterized protein (TIGR02246 family)